MEVDERPNEQYSDIGGCDKQIQELIEAVVLPMTHKERFLNLGIHPPKGVLLYGPPGKKFRHIVIQCLMSHLLVINLICNFPFNGNAYGFMKPL